jgi:predicted ATP-dependent Lon-type protease
MNLKLKEIFSGKVVNKAHTINTGVDEFPRYVLEYLTKLLQNASGPRQICAFRVS